MSDLNVSTVKPSNLIPYSIKIVSFAFEMIELVVYRLIEVNIENDKVKEISTSSIRFLDSGSGTWTTILLGFASSRVCDEEGSVVLQKLF